MADETRLATEALLTFLQTRRSIRRFKPDAVPAAIIERILVAATFAPSAHNLQPWRFALVQNPQNRKRLGQALTTAMRADMQAQGAPEAEIAARVERSLQRLRAAPVVILLCREVTAVRADAPEEVIMSIQSVAAAGLQLLLAAHAEGLGGNWICWPLYTQQAARAALDLPQTWEPQGMFFLGSPNESPAPRQRRPLEEVVRYI